MQECGQESELGTTNATTAIVGAPSPPAGRPRILYALGPGNVVDAYRKWSAGLDCTTETSVTFSSQFFDFCKAHGAEAWAVSSHPAREVFRDGTFTVENRPKRFADPRGLLFHLNQILYGFSIMWSALCYRADVLIVDSGTTHWFVLSLLSLSRIRVVASLHNSYWASGFLPGGAIKRVIRTLDGGFWRRTADATLCV